MDYFKLVDVNNLLYGIKEDKTVGLLNNKYYPSSADFINAHFRGCIEVTGPMSRFSTS